MKTDPDNIPERFEKHLRNAGLDGAAFIDVTDGTKQSTVRHDHEVNRLTAEEVSGNYGIYAGTKLGDGVLVDFDVDDYEVQGENEGLSVINDLADTFTVETPHTNGKSGGHRFYKVIPGEEHKNAVDALRAVTGREDAKAVNPSWGTVRVLNGYVVGPGSQLDGCDKDWCDKCADPDGGWYRISHDVSIATLTADEFAAVLKADEKVNPTPTPEAGAVSTPKTPTVDDEALWNRMFDAKNGDAIKRLYNGDTSAYGGDHSDARFALLSHLAFWTGKDRAQMDRMFRQSDLYPHPSKNGKWDRVGDDEIEKAIAGTDEVYTGRGADPDEALEELEGLLAKYEAAADDNDDDEISDPDRWRLGELLGHLTDEDYNEIRQRAATVLDSRGEAIDRHRALERYRWSFNTDGPVNVIAENGKTWYIGGVPLHRVGKPILNFEIDPEAILLMEDGTEMAELAIDFRDRELSTIVDTGAFQDRREFDNKVINRWGMRFTPHRDSVRDSLDDLNQYIEALDPPRLSGTHHMGLHGDEWVVPGGSLGPDGWITEPETVYLEESVAPERMVTIPMDRDDYDVDDVATILRKLPHTRPVERMVPVLGWFYAAPFRPHIVDVEGDFNHLNVTGDTGTGKTSTFRYLWRCFGMGDEPFSANDTPFAHTRIMSATNAFPTWYDEYKPAEMDHYRRGKFHTLIRKAATGGVETRGNPDKTTDEYHLRAPLAITGEEQLNPPAERRRSIILSFKKSTVAEGSKYRRVYHELAGEAHMDKNDAELIIPDNYPHPDDHALAYYQYVTNLDHETVVERWHDAKRAVAEHRHAWDDVSMGDMEQQGLQTILFGWSNYIDFADRHGVTRDELPDEDAIDAGLRLAADAVEATKSHTSQFLELASRAASRGALEEGQEYAVVYEGTEREEIRIHIDHTYDALSAYVKRHDLTGEDLLGTARDYKKRFKDIYEDENDHLVVSWSQKTPPIGYPMGVKVNVAEERLNFDRSAFDVSEPAEEATTLANLPTGEYVTIEARVVDYESGSPTGGPGCQGALQDDTKTVDMVCWREMDDLDIELEEGKSYRFIEVQAGENHLGGPQIEIIPGLTSVEPTQAGVGNAPDDDPGENERLPTVSDGGDVEDATGRVNEYLRVAHESGDEVTVAKIAGETGISPEKATHALGNLADRGRVLRGADGDTFRIA